MEPTPTAPLDRGNDRVYDSTTSVVRAVMSLSQGVQAHQTNLYLDLVKKVRQLTSLSIISSSCLSPNVIQVSISKISDKFKKKNDVKNSRV